MTGPKSLPLYRRPAGYALIIAGLLVAWVASGMIGGDDPKAAEPQDKPAADLVKVKARRITALPYRAMVIAQGHSEAERQVVLRAETDGRVIATPVAKGHRVEAGAVICELAEDFRAADLAESEALAAQRALEYQAAVKLAAKGYRSEVDTANRKALYDAAIAAVSRAKVELGHIHIKAPFAGLVDDRPAEIGDYLQKGAACATLVDDDPLLVVAEVSEQDLGHLAVGMAGTARMSTGEQLAGHIRFIGRVARPETRTFRVELEIARDDRRLASGITAEMRIPLAGAQAHFISPALLVLSDDGTVGVRAVDSDDKVVFHAVEIVGAKPDGVWLTGLPDHLTLITVGQEFVAVGERVEVTLEREATPS